MQARDARDQRQADATAAPAVARHTMEATETAPFATQTKVGENAGFD